MAIPVSSGRPSAYNIKYRWEPRDTGDADIPAVIHRFAKRMRRLYWFWWAVHYTVGMTGLVSGTMLAAASGVSTKEATSALLFIKHNNWLFGVVAVVSTSMVTFLGPLQKAEKYFAAYHELEQACLEYEASEGTPRIRQLLDRVKAARKLLQVPVSNTEPTSTIVSGT